MQPAANQDEDYSQEELELMSRVEQAQQERKRILFEKAEMDTK